ncbi:hypothetical protein NKDENANG_00403 [Candidatus Entotheonellaceae bacterium PAL068K]
MAVRRLTRKEIKQPDQFITSAVGAIDWVKAHLHHLFYGILGVVVILGLAVGWSAWQRSRGQKADVLLYQAVKLLDADEDGGGDPATSRPQPEAAEQQLHLVIRNYAGTPAAVLAHWYLGHLYFEQGDYATALAAYEQTLYRLGRKTQRLLPVLVRLNIGYVHEASGACDNAMASFETVVDSSADWLHGEAFAGLGRCYERMGATDAAIALYERALADAAVHGRIQQQFKDRLGQLRMEAKNAPDMPSTVPKSQ